MLSPGDLGLHAVFLTGAAFCFWHGVRGLRGGPVWIDATDELDERDDFELRPLALHGMRARVLGSIYFLTGIGCVAVVLRMHF